MTRINTIPVDLLTDQHLMAEYRELPMVNASLARTLRSKRGMIFSNIPPHYTLNKGHVTFHYNKGLYLFSRFNMLVEELNKRGYNVKPDDRIIDWNVFHSRPGLWNDWWPSFNDHHVNVSRIVDRIQAKTSWYRYHGSQISDDFVQNTYSKYVNLQED